MVSINFKCCISQNRHKKLSQREEAKEDCLCNVFCGGAALFAELFFMINAYLLWARITVNRRYY